MRDSSSRVVAYSIVALGCMLAAAVAVVPFYSASYALRFGVLMAGVLPYLVYAMFPTFVRGLALVMPGVIILAIDVAVKIPERFLRYDGFVDGLVFYVPLVSTLIVLPVAFAIVRRVSPRVEDDDVGGDPA
jgi:hypothetical protein